MSESELKRVRVLEPRPDLPAAEMPVFGAVLARKTKFDWPGLVLAPLLSVLVVTGYLLGFSSLTGLVTLGPFFVAGCVLAVRRFRRWHGIRGLASTPFKEVSLPPEGLFVAGAKVYFRLPGDDAVQWAEVRLPRAARLQLAAQRRVWLLGPDAKERRFLQLPGVLWPHRVRAVPAVPAKAVPQKPVEARPTVPAEDEVLLAHRARIVGSIQALIAAWVFAVLLTIAGQFFGLWQGERFPNWSLLMFTSWLLVWGFAAIGSVKRLRKPVPAGKWTELVAVPHGTVNVDLPTPINPIAAELAVLGVRVQWSNGWWVHTGLLRVDPAFAANVWATHRLWVMGEPVRGTTMLAGVPGHAVLGVVTIN